MSARADPDFGAVMSAMVTPFDTQGRLDLDAAQRLARWLVERGNDGLIVAATTGEASTLSDEERCDLLRAVSEAVTVPVLAAQAAMTPRTPSSSPARPRPSGRRACCWSALTTTGRRKPESKRISARRPPPPICR